MEKQAIKEIIYGGLSELIHNNHYYYHSSVGSNYCHFTEAGNAALQEFIAHMAVNMHQADEALLDRRAKDLVLKGLKGEKV